MNEISSFIKYQRKRLNLTQEEFAKTAGVGIRFIRELERGKESVQLNKVNQVLSLFGYSLSPRRQNIDPYTVYWRFCNKAVKITLNNKTFKYGVIIEEIKKENEIIAWRFLPNSSAISFPQTKDAGLTEEIIHSNIQNIEAQ